MKLFDLKHIFYNKLKNSYNTEEVSSLFFLCLEHICSITKIQLQLKPQSIISTSEADRFFEVLELLEQQKPIQYIFGKTEFFGLPFNVNEHVLIPRQETEELVALILQDLKVQQQNSENLTILDIGTGSGCIAISLAKKLPEANVYGLDVSKNALRIAKQNAELNDVTITYLEKDILNLSAYSSYLEDVALQEMGFLFDVIVSNPPYVRNLEKAEIQPNVLDNEPHLALFVEDNNPLVFYKAITEFALKNLKPNGNLYFEINQYLGKETKQVLANNNFNAIQLKKDINGNDRILKGTKN